MYGYSDARYVEWDDDECWDKFYFICEKRM
jgi:hypothetical protein